MGAAVMMAVSMMSVSARAKNEEFNKYGEWKVFCAPSEKNIYNYTVMLKNKYKTKCVVEYCEKFNSSVSNTYVKVSPSIYDVNMKAKSEYIFAKEKIYDKYSYNSSTNITEPHEGWKRFFAYSDKPADHVVLKEKYTAKLKYSAKNVGIYCSINGTAFLS